ncbi:hypothetical protein Tco_0474186 [Tanacetum coccineum]
MIDIGTPCRETISFIYNLVRVSILSIALVGMKCADLEFLVISATNRVSLHPDTSCQNLDEWNTLIYGIHAMIKVPQIYQSVVTRATVLDTTVPQDVLLNALVIPRRCSRRCPILNCFNLGGVNMNSLTVNHVPEKLHDTDPELTFGNLGIQFLLFKLILVGEFLTHEKASSIPIVFSWGDSISPDNFLPSILLLLVIIVAVVIVVVTVVLVVVVGEGSSIIKLLFVIIGSLHRIVLCYLIH